MITSTLYIRTDASNTIGLGHLTRCIALANIIKDQFKVTFVCKTIPANSAFQVRKVFPLLLIDQEEDFINQIEPSEIIVLDGYSFDEKYQKTIKDKGCKLVCIDDLMRGHFYADLVINYAPNVSTSKYNSESYTKFALGLDYALLRSAFLDQAQKNRITKHHRSILICFGGSDPKNNTLNALQTVGNFGNFERVIIVTGAGYQYFPNLELYTKHLGKTVNLYQNLEEMEMINVMLQADFAIVPPSGILLEAICCGLTPIIGLTASNQNNFFDFFTKNYGVLNFGNNIDSFQEKLLVSQLVKLNNQNDILPLFKERIANSRVNINKVFKDL